MCNILKIVQCKTGVFIINKIVENTGMTSDKIVVWMESFMRFQILQKNLTVFLILYLSQSRIERLELETMSTGLERNCNTGV